MPRFAAIMIQSKMDNPLTPHGTKNLGHSGSDIGVLPDGTKPLPELILISYVQWHSSENNTTRDISARNN